MIIRPAFALPIFALALAPILACVVAPPRDDFRGTALNGDVQAANFRLTDQFGAPTSLEDFSGKVALLTFLYTECTDVCPIAANHLRDVSDMLAADAPDTAIVVVSVDPVGDSVDAALAYSERWQMTDRWTYLVGGEDALRPVWAAYYIDPYIHGPGKDDAAPTRQASVGGVGALVEASGRVIHSAPIYIIDADGIMRVAFTLPFDPEDLAHDVRLVGG